MYIFVRGGGGLIQFLELHKSQQRNAANADHLYVTYDVTWVSMVHVQKLGVPEKKDE